MEPVIVSGAAAASSGGGGGLGELLAGIGWGLTALWIVFMIIREYFIDWRRSRRQR